MRGTRATVPNQHSYDNGFHKVPNLMLALWNITDLSCNQHLYGVAYLQFDTMSGGVLGRDFEVRSIPGKGRGLFALRAFARHELVFRFRSSSPQNPGIFMNNDCTGNCFMRVVDEDRGTTDDDAWASRVILAGDELTRPYLGDLVCLSTAEAQVKLQDKFGFDCDCAMHSHPTGELALLKDRLAVVYKSLRGVSPLTPDSDLLSLQHEMSTDIIPRAARLGVSRYDICAWQNQVRDTFNNQGSPALAHLHVTWAERSVQSYTAMFGATDNHAFTSGARQQLDSARQHHENTKFNNCMSSDLNALLPDSHVFRCH